MYENKVIPKGTKIVIGMYAGMAGTDGMEAYILSHDYTENDLSEIAWQAGVDHAEMYGVYPAPEFPESDDEEEDGDQYSDSIEGWWEIYNEEEHAGHCISGDQKEVHFNEL